MNTELDHLVVVARSLADGVAWCEATFGIEPGPGGRHALMGTHNRVFSVSGAGFERVYLEVIAIDPDAPPPGRARWFGMDGEAPAVPQLVHVAARTANLDMHRWGLVAAGFNPGDTLAAERDTPHGRLRWRIVVPADGRLLCGGALPTLIEWGGPHPADHLPASGVQLEALTLRGLPAAAAQVLRLKGIELRPGPSPALEAHFSTPRGPVTLASPSP